MSLKSPVVVNSVMAVALGLVVWNLVHAKRKGEINVGFAKYILDGSPAMRKWFVGGVIINVIWAFALLVGFVVQLLK